MRSTRQLSVTLPVELAAQVKARVASGEYASESEVIRDGLRALQARERAVDSWLREQITPIYDAMVANPARVRSRDDVKTALTAERDRRS